MNNPNQSHTLPLKHMQRTKVEDYLLLKRFEPKLQKEEMFHWLIQINGLLLLILLLLMEKTGFKLVTNICMSPL